MCPYLKWSTERRLSTKTLFACGKKETQEIIFSKEGVEFIQVHVDFMRADGFLKYSTKEKTVEIIRGKLWVWPLSWRVQMSPAVNTIRPRRIHLQAVNAEHATVDCRRGISIEKRRRRNWINVIQLSESCHGLWIANDWNWWMNKEN